MSCATASAVEASPGPLPLAARVLAIYALAVAAEGALSVLVGSWCDEARSIARRGEVLLSVAHVVSGLVRLALTYLLTRGALAFLHRVERGRKLLIACLCAAYVLQLAELWPALSSPARPFPDVSVAFRLVVVRALWTWLAVSYLCDGSVRRAMALRSGTPTASYPISKAGEAAAAHLPFAAKVLAICSVVNPSAPLVKIGAAIANRGFRLPTRALDGFAALVCLASFVLCAVGSVGLLLRRDWGRKLLIVGWCAAHIAGVLALYWVFPFPASFAAHALVFLRTFTIAGVFTLFVVCYLCDETLRFGMRR